MNKNIKTKDLWLGLLLLIILLIIVNWDTINTYLFHNQNIESFTSKLNTAIVEYEYDKQEPGKYPETIYEKAIKINFKDYPALICNMIPTIKSS